MEQEDKPRKAASIAWSEETTTPEGVWCEFVYTGIAYSFDTTYSRLMHTQWSEWSIEDLFRSIGNDLDKYQYSSTLQDLLNEQAVTLRVFPVDSWYEAGGLWEVGRKLPTGKRRRPKELVSHFLADVFQDYIDKYHDTSSKDELWNWLFMLWHDRPRCNVTDKWTISGDPETGYTYTRKSDGATSKTPMNRESFRTQFKRLINTTSYTAEFMKWAKNQEAIEKMNNKKPRGRPRKKYP